MRLYFGTAFLLVVAFCFWLVVSSDKAIANQLVSSYNNSIIKEVFSGDVFNINLVVNFTKGMFSAGEAVHLAIRFTDAQTGYLPSGSTLQARVNGVGSYTNVFESSADSEDAELRLPTPSGVIPTMVQVKTVVGGWFHKSRHDQARFDTQNYTFNVGIDTGAPSTPEVSGTCNVGAESTLQVSSIDPENGQIYFSYFFEGESTPTRVPESGYTQSGESVTITRTPPEEGLYTLYIRAIDDASNASEWSEIQIPCGDTCIHCLGGDTDISLQAQPSIVHSGESTDLVWELSSVYDCSLIGDNGDEWGWNFIRVSQTALTSSINKETLYTMTCKDLADDIVQATTTVHTSPAWQEI